MVSLLILCPSLSIDARNDAGVTPLMKAALQGRVRCTRLLLLAGIISIILFFFFSFFSFFLSSTSSFSSYLLCVISSAIPRIGRGAVSRNRLQFKFLETGSGSDFSEPLSVQIPGIG